MNIWDPIWKEEKEDSISDPVYKLKPVQITLNGITLRRQFYKYDQLIYQRAFFDIEFKEDYINSLDVEKRKIWVLDDGGCVVTCQISGMGISSAVEKDINNAMKRAAQRKWVATKITNGIRLSVDLPRYVLQPRAGWDVTAGSASYSYTWDFGRIKLLIPQPMQFDSSVVTINARFEYSYITDFSIMGNRYDFYATNTEHVSNVYNYKMLSNLQFEKLELVALHKFTIESAKNLINEIKDVIAVPMPTRNYQLDNHPDIPITYARTTHSKSIGSSSRPKDKCSKEVYPNHKTDQTQSSGRSLIKLGIVNKLLSIIKRRKREIK